jgi:hypothetical protein
MNVGNSWTPELVIILIHLLMVRGVSRYKYAVHICVVDDSLYCSLCRVD